MNRIAIKYDYNNNIKQEISLIVQNINEHKNMKQNVLSYFKLNGKLHSISNGYDIGGCKFNLNEKVNVLMKEINCNVNTWICPELSSEIARETHLKIKFVFYIFFCA